MKQVIYGSGRGAKKPNVIARLNRAKDIFAGKA